MSLTYISAVYLKPRERDYTVADTNGLYLRVWPSGKKTWLWRKKQKGKLNNKTLGEFPHVSIQAARKKAAKLSQDVVKKINISGMTFREVYDAWMVSKQSEIKDWKRIAQRFDKYLTLYYDRPYVELGAMEMFSVLKTIFKAGHTETAKRVAFWLAQMERFAQAIGVIEVQRLQGLARSIPKANHASRPSFPPQELPVRMADIMRLGFNSAIAWNLIRVGFFTLLRPGEYIALQWNWIDLNNDVITMPADAMKMKREHRVPITRQLKSLLQNMRHTSIYVFPAPNNKNEYVCNNPLPRLFSRNGLRGILVPHGIRAIGRTWMAEHGYDHAACELCLAHVLGSAVERTYNRTDLLEKRRGIMQDWCDFVQDCIEYNDVKTSNITLTRLSTRA